MKFNIYEPFVAPMVFNLVVLFSAWLYYGHRKLWPEKPVPHGRIYRCTGCSQVYVEARDVPMSRCPRCGRFNEAVKR